MQDDDRPAPSDLARTEERQSKSKIDAVREAAGVRLRPVLMTSTATVLGHFPLVLASGMAIGTLFTVFIVPSIDVFFAPDHREE